MSSVLCPNCKAIVARVKPVRISTYPDTDRWHGPVPAAIGFVCPECDVLLPLTVASPADDRAADEPRSASSWSTLSKALDL